MRVLLGYDGSANADQAAALTASVTWSPDSVVRVVGVLESVVTETPARWTGGVAIPAQGSGTSFEAQLADVAKRVAGPERSVESAMLHGRPASVLVDEAGAFGADVVIVGSRGHGSIASLVLGSVSAEVVDHAPCPVLVARLPHVRRAVLASDGSPSAGAAEAIVAGWPLFDGVPICVVSVADVVMPWRLGIAPTMSQEVIDVYARELEEAKAAHLRVAADAAERLGRHARLAEPTLRTGDAATEIVAAAREWNGDLIVMGSRGRTGLTRLLLGSVARNVLHGTTASVLIVRDAVET